MPARRRWRFVCYSTGWGRRPDVEAIGLAIGLALVFILSVGFTTLVGWVVLDSLLTLMASMTADAREPISVRSAAAAPAA
jgi:hypothetical protein